MVTLRVLEIFRYTRSVDRLVLASAACETTQRDVDNGGTRNQHVCKAVYTRLKPGLSSSCLVLGLLFTTSTSSQAQVVYPSKATPQVTLAAPQGPLEVPQISQVVGPSLAVTPPLAVTPRWPSPLPWPSPSALWQSHSRPWPRFNALGLRRPRSRLSALHSAPATIPRVIAPSHLAIAHSLAAIARHRRGRVLGHNRGLNGHRVRPRSHRRCCFIPRSPSRASRAANVQTSPTAGVVSQLGTRCRLVRCVNLRQRPLCFNHWEARIQPRSSITRIR